MRGAVQVAVQQLGAAGVSARAGEVTQITASLQGTQSISFAVGPTTNTPAAQGMRFHRSEASCVNHDSHCHSQ